MILRTRTTLLLLIFTALLWPALQGCAQPHRTSTPVIVGIGASNEQKLLGEITIAVLERAGYRTQAKRDLGAPWMVRKAIEAGSIDLIWDYTGRVWNEELGHDQPLTNAADLYRHLRDEDVLNGLTWVDYTAVEDRNVLIAPEAWAAQAQVRSISDLAYHLQNLNPDLVLCTTSAVMESSYGPTALARVYGADFKTPNIRQMDANAAIAGLNDGSCQCALLPASSIPASAVSLRWLWDDLDLMPASNLAPVARSFTMHNYPELAPYLRRLCQALDNDTLAQLLQEVNDGKSPNRVARQFLRANDVISTPTPTPTITPSPTPTGATPTGTPPVGTPTLAAN